MMYYGTKATDNASAQFGVISVSNNKTEVILAMPTVKMDIYAA